MKKIFSLALFLAAFAACAGLLQIQPPFTGAATFPALSTNLYSPATNFVSLEDSRYNSISVTATGTGGTVTVILGQSADSVLWQTNWLSLTVPLGTTLVTNNVGSVDFVGVSAVVNTNASATPTITVRPYKKVGL